MKKTNDFPRILSSFLSNELAIVQNHSSNTITSCRDTYKRLLGYMEDIAKISPHKVRIEDLTPERITEFLNWLESDCGNSAGARNQRLSAIHSLFRYIQMQAPEYTIQCYKVLSIRFKKVEKKQVSLLTENQVKALLKAPDATTPRGRRDQALLCLLYESCARVQQFADLRVGDLRLDSPATVELVGIGGKTTRSVPLASKVASLLRQYLLEHRLDGPSCYEHPLFFNAQHKKMTRQGITNIVKKHADECGIKEISPDMLRHSKALHLMEADIHPSLIREWFGEFDYKAAEAYLKTNVDMMRVIQEKMNSARFDVIPDVPEDSNKDKSFMERLVGEKDKTD
ncbi:MAG: site-specific integrase [Deltaproteobacteria bacterium]|jgi:site-specific recombinase XerD|nr:site-specific integrase [Deltaproteobacteria bacterium]